MFYLLLGPGLLLFPASSWGHASGEGERERGKATKATGKTLEPTRLRRVPMWGRRKSDNVNHSVAMTMKYEICNPRRRQQQQQQVEEAWRIMRYTKNNNFATKRKATSNSKGGQQKELKGNAESEAEIRWNVWVMRSCLEKAWRSYFPHCEIKGGGIRLPKWNHKWRSLSSKRFEICRSWKSVESFAKCGAKFIRWE